MESISQAVFDTPAAKRSRTSAASLGIPGLVQQEKLVASHKLPGVRLELRRADRKDVSIRYGVVPGRFGDCLIAGTAAGICWLDPAPSHASVSELQNHWKSSDLRADTDWAAHWGRQIFDNERSRPSLHLLGTEFQLRVWSALMTIKRGHWMSYGALARQLGIPRGARAVGSAVARNHVALLVPCHRVLPNSGMPGHYRWGAKLKRAMLSAEAAQNVA